jgi:hypothetical protein
VRRSDARRDRPAHSTLTASKAFVRDPNCVVSLAAITSAGGLLRAGYLLTGDWSSAQDLVQTAW